MHGISSTSISLLWNGRKTLNFSQICGLRQGDPLSPYLFVLCMERLGGMIDAAVRDRNWLPLHLTKDGPRLSSPFFANDMLLFTKAKPSQACFVANLLNDFCSISGLKISVEKLRALASKGVPQACKDKLQSVTQIRFMDRIDKYLGFKMMHGRPNREDFFGLFDKVNSKLAS